VTSSPFTAVYDACVLYPAPLRDFLMWLGLSGRFRARWSARIHDEWKRNLLINRPDLSAEQLDRTSDFMESAHVCLEIQRRTTCRDWLLPVALRRRMSAAARS
jgi:hypothetical protein